jgi:5-formyltetrahydrofolate cyclo-ligase
MDVDRITRALRTEVKARMPPPGSPEHAAASRAAQERLLAVTGAARTVGLYRALPSECATSLMADALRRAGKDVCYPVIQAGRRELAFRRGEGDFRRGALGIEEPTGPEVELAKIDLLVVPAIAVDRSGHRLGRGKGHYDATLEGYRGRSVALVFETQIVENVPAAAHDRRVTAICTDARFLEVGT